MSSRHFWNGSCLSPSPLSDLFIYNVLTERQVDTLYIKTICTQLSHTHSQTLKKSKALIYSCTQKHKCFHIHRCQYMLLFTYLCTHDTHTPWIRCGLLCKRVKSLKVKRILSPFKADRITDICEPLCSKVSSFKLIFILVQRTFYCLINQLSHTKNVCKAVSLDATS